MTWTEITETDFKLSFVLSVVQNEDASDEAEASSSNPSCLSVSSALSLICVLICVVRKQNKQLPFCPFHSDVPCKKKASMVSSICGCIYVCYVWHFDSHLQYLPGQKVDDDPEKKTKKRPWKRSSCRRSNSARLVRNVSKIQIWCTSTFALQTDVNTLGWICVCSV